nr:Krueppel-like factor 16 [Halyomorpha halys]
MENTENSTDVITFFFNASPQVEELRVPPQDSFESYWAACIAAEVVAANTARPATKQRPKKFRCPHCDVAFSNNGQLKGHVRIHTGERPFRCEAEGCGKSFTRNEELTRHKRIHSGLRPFPCESCGKTFGRKDHLKKHARTHLPQTAYFIPPPLIVYPYLYGY